MGIHLCMITRPSSSIRKVSWLISVSATPRATCVNSDGGVRTWSTLSGVDSVPYARFNVLVTPLQNSIVPWRGRSGMCDTVQRERFSILKRVALLNRTFIILTVPPGVESYQTCPFQSLKLDLFWGLTGNCEEELQGVVKMP